VGGNGCTKNVVEGSRIGDAELCRRPDRVAAVPARSEDAVDDRHRGVRGRKPGGVERHGEQHAPDGIHDVSGRKVVRVLAALDEHLPFSGSERLRDDARTAQSAPRERSVNST